MRYSVNRIVPTLPAVSNMAVCFDINRLVARRKNQ